MLTTAVSGLLCLGSLASCWLSRMAGKPGISTGNTFSDCDVVVDLNVDTLNEYYLGIFPTVFTLMNILHGIAAGKPVLVLAASIAPFRNPFLKRLLRCVLNRVSVITIREDYSRAHLPMMGITRPVVRVTADLAFCVEACTAGRVDEILKLEGISAGGRPLVGMGVVHKSFYTDPEAYVRLMAAITDYLIRSLGASVVYIPNSYRAGSADDIATVEDIRRQVTGQNRVSIIRGDYRDAEIKGIMGRLELFVAAKFHPLVFATGMGVPCVGLVGYHRYKFYGVIGQMMGQQERLVNVNDYTDSEALQTALEAKIEYTWKNRVAIREELKVRAAAAREQAYFNGLILREMIAGCKGNKH
jgi:polysaccharide pyruvyl transferase WcaK-like protein